MTQIDQQGRGGAATPPPLRILRKAASAGLAMMRPAAALAVALFCGTVLLGLNGFDGISVMIGMVFGVFQDMRSVSEVLLKAVPLILIGAGLCVAFRCRMWNIGAEGQFYAGAVAATFAGVSVEGLTAWLYVPLITLAGALGGAFWGGIAGYLKVRFQASEIVTTIMLNYIALIATSYLVTGPMKDAQAAYPQSARLFREAWIPNLIPGTRLHVGILVALVLALALYVFLYRSSAGYAMRVVGINPFAAAYAGIRTRGNMVAAMCISGGMAGLAGAFEVAGVTRRLYQSISPGYGFEGIAVALLAGNNPLGAILSGGLFAVLRSGAELMQITSQVPQVLVLVIQGIVILSVVAFAAIRWQPWRKG
ncbi:ABC transporter permease [Paracoccus spongiarum]|uniref:ABC transporter permease n=1 Tax=Paracoccus spongiarum TaxID=3064387 RepID=A0ABT9JG05_9RHOB|nr:ABC transporter permease [Paracoccus sp. 2205BS29-5]MDP5308711.1 ABC transporter permease [Paracoccus sp. 2205BS29-5]